MNMKQLDWNRLLIGALLAVMIMIVGAPPVLSRPERPFSSGGHHAMSSVLNNGPAYTLTDLGGIEGSTFPHGLNDLGQVVGWPGFIWLPIPAYNLPAGFNLIGPTPNHAHAVNESGQVVGSLAHHFGPAYLWQNGDLLDLGYLHDDDLGARAFAINVQGEVVGDVYTSDHRFHAFLWLPAEAYGLPAGMHSLHYDIFSNPGPANSMAYDVNDAAQVVGQASSTGLPFAYLWQNGVVTILDEGGARAINNQGWVAGWSYEYAAVWVQGTKHVLDSLGPSRAWDINDAGQVVGYYETEDNGYNLHAFVWQAEHGMRDLNDLIPPDSGWHLSQARSINNQGQIVGRGQYNGQTRGFLLTPQPKWTLLFYLAGDNNLSASYWQAFNQLERAADNPDVQIIVAWDDITSELEYYHVQYDANLNKLADYVLDETIWKKGELDTGDPNTLSDFLLWALENFPSEHYALILDDHGQGLGTFLVDDTNGGAMNLAELKLALATVYEQTERRFDVLYMAMCLMGLIEDAYQVRDYADYYVANQDIQWSLTPPYYDYVAGVTAASTPAEVAVNFAAAYHNAAVAGNKHYTISVGDMSQLEGLVTAVDNLAVQLTAEMTAITGTLQTISAIVQRFDMNADDVIDNQDSYADLYDFAWLVSQNLGGHPAIVQAAQAVMTAVEQYIIYEQHASWPNYNLGNSHGVGIFLPTQASSFYRGSNYDFAQGTQWPWLPPEPAAPRRMATETIGWGPMLVDFFQLTQPDGPDNPYPPPPISKRLPEESLYLPLIIR